MTFIDEDVAGSVGVRAPSRVDKIMWLITSRETTECSSGVVGGTPVTRPL